MSTVVAAVVLAQDLPPSCDSPIYCYGDLLRTVQLARLFNDSKTFVDFRILNSPNETLRNFDAFVRGSNSNPSRDEIRTFVNQNFAPGDELTIATLSDFNPNPRFLSQIKDSEVRNFTRNLIAIWPTLARRVKQEVYNNEDRFSLIPVPNTFIIPGGRFREYYYWDSFWIIEGLLISGMNETARGK